MLCIDHVCHVCNQKLTLHYFTYSPTDIAKVGAHSRFGRPKLDTSKKTDDEENVPGDAVPLNIYNIEEDNESGEAGKIRKVGL